MNNANLIIIISMNQKLLQLHTDHSKLLDSLCFELSVNIPDENSLTLLQIIEMFTQREISQEQLRLLYVQWLNAKNIFDLFNAKQIRTYPKQKVIGNQQLMKQLTMNNINRNLEKIDGLYNQLYLSKKAGDQRYLNELESLFSYLDYEGNIHLRMSQLFFLSGCMLILQNYQIPPNYQSYILYFKQFLKSLCAIDGKVSFRWFKNYLLAYEHKLSIIKNLMQIFKEVSIKIWNSNMSMHPLEGLPDIFQEVMKRWVLGTENKGSKISKMKVENYARVFEEDEEAMYFNGSCGAPQFSASYFNRKYGESTMHMMQVTDDVLAEVHQIVRELLNNYIKIFSQVKAGFHKTPTHKHSKTMSNIHSHTIPSPSQNYTTYTQKKKSTGDQKDNRMQKYSMKYQYKEKTPTKKKLREYETKRNITPTRTRTPILDRHFGSTQKSKSRTPNRTPNRSTTPTKNYQAPTYQSSTYGNPVTQSYRGSKKQGLEKDSFYEKLAFFRNKRVESYDIVIKRLKGK